MSHRVCHMSTVHPTFDNRIFHKECSSLARAGYETHLVIQGNDGKCDGVTIHGLRKPDSRPDRMVHLVNEALEVGLELDAELYHLHDPELLRVAEKLISMGKHVIFDSHEFYRYQIAEKEYLPKTARWFISKVYSSYETRVCRMIDAVIVPCTRAGENPFEGRANRTVLVDNVPILPEGHPRPSFERKKRDSVCYVGGLSMSRGIKHLVMAGHRAGVRVILAGPISESFKFELESMPEYECVEYRGILDKNGVADVISESFCGAAALLNVGQYWLGDNLPTKAYEYMAGGIPFIISPTNYAKWFTERYKASIVVDPTDIDGYAKAIMRVKEDQAEATAMASRGFDALKEHYNWKIEEQKLISLYAEILDE